LRLPEQVVSLSLDDDFQKILAAAARIIHEQGSDIDLFKALSKQFQQLTKSTFEELLKGLESELKEIEDLEYIAQLQNNLFVFSGFKAYEELKQAKDLLIDDTGKTKSFANYLKDIRSFSTTYNEAYLRAEYNHAIAVAQQISIWQQYIKDKDDYDLQFDAVNDARARPSHLALDGKIAPMDDAFWDVYFPPLDWNCRCTVRRVRKDAKRKYEDLSKLTGEELKEMFRVNNAKQGTVFPETHPYFEQQNSQEIRRQIDELER
jgi:SPP1 gp7 family putative phage head morphogenesis protein